MAMDNQAVGARLAQWMARPAAPAVVPENDMSVRRPVGTAFQGWLANTLGVQNPATPVPNAVANAGGAVPVYPAPAPVASPVAAAMTVPLVAAPAAPRGKAQAALGPKSEVIDSKQEYVPDRREDFIRSMQAGMMTTGNVAQMMQASPYIRPVPMRDIALGQYLQSLNAELTRHLSNPQATPEQRQAAINSYHTRLGGSVSQSGLMGEIMGGMPEGIR